MSRQVRITRCAPLLVVLAFGLHGCGDSITDPLVIEEAVSQIPSLPDSILENRILIDASHDGGVWWFPQAGEFSPEKDHQGRAFAAYLRGWGLEVEELPRGTLLTDSLLASYKYVIRAGEWGEYARSELAAYARFVERKTTLILLSDHRGTDPSDELAESLGVTFTGAQGGDVTRLAPHSITTGVGWVPYQVGAVATSFDPAEVEILGWVNDTLPVMGVVHSTRAKVFFCGDTNLFQSVPQPLVDNLIAWGFGRE